MYLLLSPKVDFAFKKIFGSEKNKSVLISFFNAVFEGVNEKIKSFEFKNADIQKECLIDNFSRIDVKAMTDKNQIVDIEIQILNRDDMTKRTLYHWSKLYESQIATGQMYSKLNKVICINVLNFNYLKDEDEFHSVYRLKNIKNNKELTDTCEIHFVEIPKLRQLSVDDNNNKLEIWTEFLRNPESEVVKKAEENDVEFKIAKETLYKINLNKSDRERYEMRENALIDTMPALENAEQKGLEQGIQRGIQKGIEQGTLKEKIDSARRMINKGLKNEDIQAFTELDIDTIDALRKEKLNN